MRRPTTFTAWFRFRMCLSAQLHKARIRTPSNLAPRHSGTKTYRWLQRALRCIEHYNGRLRRSVRTSRHRQPIAVTLTLIGRARYEPCRPWSWYRLRNGAELLPISASAKNSPEARHANSMTAALMGRAFCSQMEYSGSHPSECVPSRG